MNIPIIAILFLAAACFVAWRAAPRESAEDAFVHGAGQVGLLGALALFGVDYFTSYFYAAGEMMSALHPHGLQEYAFIAVAVISGANLVFGGLYIYALGVFRDGGGAYSAALRYLGAGAGLVVAVVLIQDYVMTIVVSSLSGVDQLLSIFQQVGIAWYYHVALGGSLCAATWYLTIRGRAESVSIVVGLLTLFVILTLAMFIGLVVAVQRGVQPAPAEELLGAAPSVTQALFHLLTASMKGMVALTGLEAMSNGIQFVVDEDAPIVTWGRKHLPRLRSVWQLYSGAAGIGRLVQTAFILYGAITTTLLTYYSIHFNVFDGTGGMTLVGNLASIGFNQMEGGWVLYWAYQLLAVVLLAGASLTAFQDLQAVGWRNVAAGNLPEYIAFRNTAGTFTRPVTAGLLLALLVTLAVRGKTTVAVPFYGVGVFLPITAMSLSIRAHIAKNATGAARLAGMFGATTAAMLAITIFFGQIIGKWHEGGWGAAISIAVVIVLANLLLIAPVGYRDPEQIRTIIREKSRIEGHVGSLVTWQAMRMQEYRYSILLTVSSAFAAVGVFRPMQPEKPPAAGSFDAWVFDNTADALNMLANDLPEAGAASSKKH